MCVSVMLCMYWLSSSCHISHYLVYFPMVWQLLVSLNVHCYHWSPHIEFTYTNDPTLLEYNNKERLEHTSVNWVVEEGLFMFLCEVYPSHFFVIKCKVLYHYNCICVIQSSQYHEVKPANWTYWNAMPKLDIAPPTYEKGITSGNTEDEKINEE